MTVVAKPFTGAPSATLPHWENILWRPVVAHVRRLQMRIAKAHQEGKRSKVNALQRILTCSHYAKLLAVKRVVQNQGAKTPGVDKVIWNTPAQKMKAALSLKRQGYQTKPLRRIYIPKKQKGKLRPLSIPVMDCRAQQALYLLSLEPIAEFKADKNAYGFRPFRSTADAIEQCFSALARKSSAQYILEGDIRSCFDSISHSWMLKNIPMDKKMLRKWLEAGYIVKEKFYSTDTGTPQGGIISPTLLTLALSGLEQAVKAITQRQDKINVSIYADDFIITGASKEVLENKVKPAVENFLRERGLTLSPDKTKITHIQEGFDFLGMNIRKYKDKLIITPAKSGVKRFLADVREIIKHNATTEMESLIGQLNCKIRGWANYYRHVCAKKTFGYVDHCIFQSLWRWAVRRHPTKGAKWVRKKYFRKDKLRNWVFSTTIKNERGNIQTLDLMGASKVPIKRHVKIQANATPYDSVYHDYFNRRTRKEYDWWVCWWNLLKPKKRTDEAGLPIAA
jgi:RNA-directed DNA polymerase